MKEFAAEYFLNYLSINAKGDLKVYVYEAHHKNEPSA